MWSWLQISSPTLPTSWPEKGLLPANGSLYHHSLSKKAFIRGTDGKNSQTSCSSCTWTSTGHSELGMFVTSHLRCCGLLHLVFIPYCILRDLLLLCRLNFIGRKEHKLSTSNSIESGVCQLGMCNPTGSPSFLDFQAAGSATHSIR